MGRDAEPVRSRPLTVLLAVLALAAGGGVAATVAACGEDRGSSTGADATEGAATTEGKAATGPVVETVSVSETEFRLDPANPRVAREGVVAFRVANEGQTVHALEVHSSDGEVETRELEPGASQTIRARLEPGRYEWYCPVGDHKDRGMRGTVTVAGGGGATTDEDSGTTTEEESDDSGGGGSDDDGY